MIEIVKLTGSRVEESAKLKKILSRGIGLNNDILTRTDAIIRETRERGDAALVEFTARFDGVQLTPDTLRVDQQVIETLAAQVD
ncbi:MAG: histidinol dehydrogenase, partial [Blastocatellia bacterium]